MTNFETTLNKVIKNRLGSGSVNLHANIICELFDFCDDCPGNNKCDGSAKCLDKFEEWLSQEADTEPFDDFEKLVSNKAGINMQTGYIRKVGRYLGDDDAVKQTLVNSGYLLMKIQTSVPYKPDQVLSAFDIFAVEEPTVKTVNNTDPLIEEGGKN